MRLPRLLEMLHGGWDAKLMTLFQAAHSAQLRWNAAMEGCHVGAGCYHCQAGRLLSSADWQVKAYALPLVCCWVPALLQLRLCQELA